MKPLPPHLLLCKDRWVPDMHRNELLSLLNEYRPHLLSEAGYVERTKRFVATHEDCFHTDLMPGHVTGSAWVVNPHRDKALMLHHKKLNRWFQPGGHADRDSNIQRVALRETSEETGLAPEQITLVSQQIFDVDIHIVPANQYGPRHTHFDIRFLLEVDDKQAIPGNNESHQILWIPLHLAVQYNHNLSTYRMVEKTRQLRI